MLNAEKSFSMKLERMANIANQHAENLAGFNPRFLSGGLTAKHSIVEKFD